MKVKVVNLDKRTDRWKRMQHELSNCFGLLEFERFSAYSQPSAVVGNALSHIECLKQGADLIFEDDIYFEPFAREIFERAVNQLPDDFDILYLGGNIIEPIYRVSENLYRCTAAWGSNGILYSEKGRKYILNLYNPLDTKFAVYDDWLRKQSQHDLKAYLCAPIIQWTYAGFSDVNNTHADYEKLMKLNAKQNMK